jgi:hypothetical protein
MHGGDVGVVSTVQWGRVYSGVANVRQYTVDARDQIARMWDRGQLEKPGNIPSPTTCTPHAASWQSTRLRAKVLFCNCSAPPTVLLHAGNSQTGSTGPSGPAAAR